MPPVSFAFLQMPKNSSHVHPSSYEGTGRLSLLNFCLLYSRQSEDS